jgi:AcrR family transcriptional regulator
MEPLQDHRHRFAAVRRERMRARLLNSALELVALHGMAAATIDNIVARAKVSRGTFYHYFDTPDAVIQALAFQLSNDLLRLAEQLVVEHADPAERLSAGVRMLMRFCSARPVIGGFVSRLGWPNVDRTFLLFEYVQRDVQTGLQAGRFKDMPIPIALNFIAGTVIGGIASMIEAREAGESFPEHAAAVVLRALGIKPKEIERIVSMHLSAPGKELYPGLVAQVA